MNRIVVYLLYDRAGIADAGVLRALEGLRPHASTLFVVVNGTLTAESRVAVEAIADTVWMRDNTGFDVGAYRAAIERIGEDALAGCDELLLVNYTFLGPMTTFEGAFAWAERSGLDVWGLTEHGAITPDPYTHGGTLPAHLQSHWVGVRTRVLVSEHWREYWASMPEIATYDDSVRQHEARFSTFFADRGFAVGAAFPAARFELAGEQDAREVANASIEAPLALLEAGAPLVKRRLFFHGPVELDDRGVDAAEVAGAALEAGYPADVLAASLARFAAPRTLAAGVFGGVRLLSDAPEPEWAVEAGTGDRLADISGLRVRLVPAGFWWRLAHGDHGILQESDVVLVTSEHPFGERSGHGAAAWQRARRTAEEAMLGHVTRLAWAFADEPRLGALVPLAPHIGTTVLGHGWGDARTEAAELASRLGVTSPLDEVTPLAPFAGFAAYRSAALLPLAAALEARDWSVLAARFPGVLLEQLLDTLAARSVIDAGFAAAEAQTAAELAISHAHLVAKASHLAAAFPARVGDAHRYARLRQPGAHPLARVGETLLRRAPGLARLLRRTAARGQAWMRGLRRGSR